MKCGLLWFLAAISVTSSECAEAAGAHRMNENPLICRAVFDLVVKVYESGHDPDNAAIYREKFERLGPDAIEEFEARGNGKEGVDDYVLQYVDRFTQMVRQDAKALPPLLAFCNNVYP
jgi:hypothetical protein